jgi:hypothetical protein
MARLTSDSFVNILTRRGNSIMTRAISALLAAATIAGMAAPVAAQTYYARERIMGIPKRSSPPAAPEQPAYGYTPVYSSIYSECTTGTQTAPIRSCTRSDGQAATISDCSSSPQTVSRNCSITSDGTCRPLQQDMANTGSGGLVISTGTISTPDQAQDLCDAYAKTKPALKGACYYANSRVVFYQVGTGLRASTNGSWASLCNQ